MEISDLTDWLEEAAEHAKATRKATEDAIRAARGRSS